MEASTSFSWPRRTFRIQQDTFLSDVPRTITEATTENRPSSSGSLDSDTEGNSSPSGVLHRTRGSGNQPAEVHSSRVSPWP